MDSLSLSDTSAGASLGALFMLSAPVPFRSSTCDCDDEELRLLLFDFATHMFLSLHQRFPLGARPLGRFVCVGSAGERSASEAWDGGDAGVAATCGPVTLLVRVGTLI